MYVLYHRRDDREYEKQHCFNEHKGIRLTLYSALYPGRLVSAYLRPVRYQCRRTRHHFLLTSVGGRVRGNHERLRTDLRCWADHRRTARRSFRPATRLLSRSPSLRHDLIALQRCSDGTAARPRAPDAGALRRGHGAAGARTDPRRLRRKCAHACALRVRRIHWSWADHGAGARWLDSRMGYTRAWLAHDLPRQYPRLPYRCHGMRFSPLGHKHNAPRNTENSSKIPFVSFSGAAIRSGFS